MKITKTQLKKIIKEELEVTLSEAWDEQAFFRRADLDMRKARDSHAPPPTGAGPEHNKAMKNFLLKKFYKPLNARGRKFADTLQANPSAARLKILSFAEKYGKKNGLSGQEISDLYLYGQHDFEEKLGISSEPRTSLYGGPMPGAGETGRTYASGFDIKRKGTPGLPGPFGVGKE